MSKSINTKVTRWLSTKPARYINSKSSIGNPIRFDGGESFITKISKLEPILAKITIQDINKYVDPSFKQLKQTIAKHEDIEDSMISITDGADGAIELIPRILLNKNDKVLVIEPTFFRFRDATLKEGASVLSVQTEESDDFTIADGTIEKVIKITRKEKVKLIWLANPNNPTGQVISLRLIQKLLENTTCILVVDESLIQFLPDHQKFSAINLVNNSERLIILKSLSKVFGLAGLRVGWIITNPKLAAVLEDFRPPYNISTISEKIAREAILSNNLALIQNTISKERNFIIENIRKLDNLHLVGNSQINILLIKHKTKLLFNELLDKNILTADFNTTEALRGKGYTRITLQDRHKNLILIKALESIN